MRMSASSLLDAIDCRVGVLSQKLDPGLLGARIVLGGFDQIARVPREQILMPYSQ